MCIAIHLLSGPDPMERIDDSPFYQFILNMNQPLCIEDIRELSNWKEVSALGDLRTWMGLPLRNEHDPLGVLSLARRSRSPFNKDEMDIAQAFADYITIALNKSAKPTKQSLFLSHPTNSTEFTLAQNPFCGTTCPLLRKFLHLAIRLRNASTALLDKDISSSKT